MILIKTEIDTLNAKIRECNEMIKKCKKIIKATHMKIDEIQGENNLKNKQKTYKKKRNYEN